MDKWLQFKIDSEKYFEEIEPHPDVWGGQLQKNTKWNKGLTIEEIQKVESLWQLEFPKDYKAMLQVMNGLNQQHIFLNPDGNAAPYFKRQVYQYPIDREAVQWLVDEIQEHIEFAIEALGYDEFDTTDIEGFIPVYAHRALVVFKNKDWSPVISVHGDDIIVYGKDLLSYWQNELGLK